MKKYVMVRTEKFETSTQVFDSLDQANAEAEYLWNKRLTAIERRHNHIQVGWCEDNLKYFSQDQLQDPDFDWTCGGFDYDDSCFDSDKR